MNNGLLYLGGLLTLVLAMLFGAPYFIDWNGYRGVFEEEASKVLGRDVRVGGDVNVRFLPTPFVRFEKVRLADTTGQTGEPFIRADSFTMRLAVSPLLRGAFEAKEIELHRPVLSLALDGAGSGNWSTLELRPAELPFVPQNVALHSVRLYDGAISIHRADGAVITNIDDINGELTADSLKGPFKFKGSTRTGEAERDVRFTTTSPDAAGAVHVKASMSGGASANSYVFDGTLQNLTTAPKIIGELTGKINLPRATSVTPEQSQALPVLNLKTTTTADALGATFENVELELDGAAEAQLLSGKASAKWGDALRFDTKLAAKWLDLDRLGASQGQQAGIDDLQRLFVALVEGLGADGSASVQLDIDQAKFAGEQAGSLNLDAERRNDVVTLRRLSGGLPGGARFELSGEISGAKSADKSFKGEGAVRGVNFARVQAFAKKSGIDIDLKSDGPFWVAGHVAMSPGNFILTEAKALLSGQPVAGEVRIESGARQHTTVRLDGDDIDSAVFFPEQAGHISHVWRQALGLVGDGATKEPVLKALASGRGTTVDVSARRLKHDGKIYTDVDALIVIDAKHLALPRARLTTEKGAHLSMTGRIARASSEGEAAKGVLSYEIDADNSAAIGEVSKLLGFEEILDKQLTALPSMRVAGLVQIGKRQPKAADVTFDGLVGGARVIGDGTFDRGFSSWRTEPVRLVATLRSGDLGEILKLAGAEPTLLSGLKSRSGEASLAISGLLSQGAKSLTEVSAQGLSAILRGTVAVQDAQSVAFDVAGDVEAEDAREALVLAGIVAPAALPRYSLKGPVTISTRDGITTLSSRGLKTDSNVIKGSVKLSGSGGVSDVDADVQVDRATVPGLLSWLSERSSPAAAEDVEEGIWPTAPLNFQAFAHNRGKVHLKVARLELADGLIAQNADASMSFADNKVSIDSLKADAAGGELAVHASIEQVAGGYTLSGKFALDADLSALNASAVGRADLQFEGTGRALSPATLIEGLTGKGTIKLTGVRHPGPSAALLADASDDVMASKMENTPEVLASGLSSALGSSLIVVGDKVIGFNVSGGTVKVDAFTVKSPQGTARNMTTASLTSLALNSSWQVSAIASPLPPPPEAGPNWAPAPKGPLPAVEFFYTGALGDLAGLQVKVDTADLQRELAVRQMERKVEELEVLRQNDEERQRLDVERRQALEAERTKAAEAAAKARQDAARDAEAKRRQSQSDVPSNDMPPILPDPNDTGAITPQAGSAEDKNQVAEDPVTSTPRSTTPTRASNPRPRVQRQRRSTTDELNRAFGSWP